MTRAKEAHPRGTISAEEPIMNPEVYSELENGTAAASVITSSAWPALLAPVADPALDPDIVSSAYLGALPSCSRRVLTISLRRPPVYHEACRTTLSKNHRKGELPILSGVLGSVIRSSS